MHWFFLIAPNHWRIFGFNFFNGSISVFVFILAETSVSVWRRFFNFLPVGKIGKLGLSLKTMVFGWKWFALFITTQFEISFGLFRRVDLILLRRFQLISFGRFGLGNRVGLCFLIVEEVFVFVFWFFLFWIKFVFVVSLRVDLSFFEVLVIRHGISNYVLDLVGNNAEILDNNNWKFLGPGIIDHASVDGDDKLILEELVLGEDLLVNDEAVLEFAEPITEFAPKWERSYE